TTHTTHSYTISLHDALPISQRLGAIVQPAQLLSWFELQPMLLSVEVCGTNRLGDRCRHQQINREPRFDARPDLRRGDPQWEPGRSEEHTSELQSHLISYAVF